MRVWSADVAMRTEALALATLSLGAAGIHFAAIGQHFAEYVPFGVFFSLIGWFQGLWAIAYVVRPARPLAGAALLANAATILIWDGRIWLDSRSGPTLATSNRPC